MKKLPGYTLSELMVTITVLIVFLIAFVTMVTECVGGNGYNPCESPFARNDRRCTGYYAPQGPGYRR